jgi:acetyltransferase-like isoleucine patch superfamily enzyme
MWRKKLYMSPVGSLLSYILGLLAFVHRPRMLYGFKDPLTGIRRKYSRVGSTVAIEGRKSLSMGEHVWIWHHTIIDATGGVEIGEGCQIGAWVGIFTHSSHDALRLMGRNYISTDPEKREGYVSKPVKIGAYTFISSGSVVMPGVTIGKGCVIGPGSIVMRDVPDYAIMSAAPARQFGATTDTDRSYLIAHPNCVSYYDQELKANLLRSDGKRE